MKKNKNVHNATHGIATCCICGKKLDLSFSHNPYPVREESWYGQKENRCCSDCNGRIVIPARISLPYNDILTRNILIARFKNMSYEELRASLKPLPSMGWGNCISDEHAPEFCDIA